MIEINKAIANDPNIDPDFKAVFGEEETKLEKWQEIEEIAKRMTEDLDRLEKALRSLAIKTFEV